MDLAQAAAVQVEDAEVRRANAVASYLATIEVLGRMVDRLGELHADLDPGDRLLQGLHSLGFVWEHVEEELRAAAARGVH